MVQLMRTGQYDGVSASGNATARLVDGDDVDPVNVDLVPNYETIFSDLKDQPYNTFDGQPYGIPHGRGANLLMWNEQRCQTRARLLGRDARSENAAKYKGKISAYDDPIYIADAAVYLMTHEPDLGIENPYELNEEQFEAAVDLLKEQRANVGEYWSEATKQISAFANGDATVGTTWQYQYFAAPGRRRAGGRQPRQPGLPAQGGRDRLVGHLDDQLGGQTPELHVHVDGLDRRTRKSMPKWPNSSARRRPRASRATKPRTKNFCEKYHADNPAFWKRVYYWETPLADCGNGNDDCKDYNEWVQAWTAIKG